MTVSVAIYEDGVKDNESKERKHLKKHVENHVPESIWLD